MKTVATQRTFTQRAQVLAPYIAPATLLAGPSEDERYQDNEPSLRELASKDGFCYLHVLRPLGTTGLYQAEVAATPEGLKQQPYPVFFSEEQLYPVLSWDVRTQALLASDPDRLYRLLYIHAAEIRPLVPVAPVCTEEDQVAQPEEPLSAMEVEIPATADMPHVMLPPLDDEQSALVSKDALALQRACYRTVSRLVGTVRMQHTFLDALLSVLALRLRQVREETQEHLLRSQHALIGRVQNWYQRTHQRVVVALPVFDERHHCLLWRATVGVPASCLFAA